MLLSPDYAPNYAGIIGSSLMKGKDDFHYAFHVPPQ